MARPLKEIRPGQNLDRARTQFKLVVDMEARWGEMTIIVKTAARSN